MVAVCIGVISVAHATESIWEAVRTPGSVVVLRHSFASGGFDPPDARLYDCSTQRNLDERGRAQAQRIGAAFRQNGVAVGAVLSSPRCRCLDTARLAFGQAQPWDVLQGALNDAERRQHQLAGIKKAIAEHRCGPTLVLVTHGSVVTERRVHASPQTSTACQERRPARLAPPIRRVATAPVRGASPRAVSTGLHRD